MIEKSRSSASSDDALEGEIIDPPMSSEEARRLQQHGRKPRMPTVNEEGEIIGWGVTILVNDTDVK